jgi:hypothetical protein
LAWFSPVGSEPVSFFNRPINVAPAQSDKATAAIAHQAPTGSGRKRSTRMPAAAADKTIGSGW